MSNKSPCCLYDYDGETMKCYKCKKVNGDFVECYEWSYSCSNCKFWGWVSIPKGTLIASWGCPNCGCKTLQKSS